MLGTSKWAQLLDDEVAVARLSIDPADADLFFVPLLPRRKAVSAWGRASLLVARMNLDGFVRSLRVVCVFVLNKQDKKSTESASKLTRQAIRTN